MSNEERIYKLELVLATLITWLHRDLGDHGVKQLLEMLEEGKEVVVNDFTVIANTPKIVPKENWMTLADAMKLKGQAFDAGYKSGMERSVEILNSSSHREEAEYRIRKEIDNG